MTSPTGINDIGDLLRILEEQPEWAERLRVILLTREVLELPERLTQLTERVERLARAQEETNARLDRFIQAQEEANARIDRRLESLEEANRTQQEFNAELREFNAEQRVLNAELREFNAEQRKFNAEQQEFNAEQRKFNAEQQEMIARMDRRLESLEESNRNQQEFNAEQREINARVDGRLDNLENQVSEIRTQVGDLQGSDLENRLHGNITSIAARNFNLRRVHILKSRFFPPDQNFYDRLYAAEDGGRITSEQALQLQEADFILSAQERESQGLIYLAVEVSRTVDGHDITRARERADALQAATDVRALAMVVGSFIPEPELARAVEHNVALIQEPTG